MVGEEEEALLAPDHASFAPCESLEERQHVNSMYVSFQQILMMKGHAITMVIRSALTSGILLKYIGVCIC